jgi:chorismate dehydratase
VAIGDKTFGLVNQYKYVYDLAGEWIRFTSQPFVFAVWLRIKSVEQERLEALNEALAWGIARKADALEYFRDKLPPCGDCLKYLEENISYDLDDKKKAGMKLFLRYLSDLK